MASNKTIEQKAIQLVKDYYTEPNAPPARKGSGYDLKMGNKRIEVKGTNANKPYKGFVISSIQEAANLLNGGFIFRVIKVNSKKPVLYRFSSKDVDIKLEFRARVSIKNTKIKGIEIKHAQRPPTQNR